MTGIQGSNIALRSALYLGEDDDLKEAVRVSILSKYTMDSMGEIPQLWPKEVDLVLMEFNGDKTESLANISQVLTMSKGIPLYILLKKKDVDFIIEASHYGVQGFIECPKEVLHILSIIHMQDRRRQGKNGNVSSFFSLKGGVGRTALATNIASQIRGMTDQHAVLVDLNVPLGDTALYLNMEERQLYTITDFIYNLNRFDENLIYKSLSKHESGLFLLPLPGEITELDSLNGQMIKTIITSLRKYFDHVIIDCASNLSDVTLSCLDESDNIVLVGEPSLASLRAVNKVIQLSKRLGYQSDSLKLIINRNQSSVDDNLRSVIKALEVGCIAYVDNDYMLFNESLINGELIEKFAPHSKVNKQLQGISHMLHHGVPHQEMPSQVDVKKANNNFSELLKYQLLKRIKRPLVMVSNLTPTAKKISPPKFLSSWIK